MKKLIEISAVDITLYKFALPLMNNLREKGWDVSVCATDSGYRTRLVEQGFLVHDITIPRSLAPTKLIKAFICLIKLMKTEKPDCIHVHTPIAAILARVAGKISGVPNIVYTLHGLYMKPPFLQLEKWICNHCTDYIFTVNEEDKAYLISHQFIAKDKIRSINGVGIDTEVFNPNTITDACKQKLKTELGLTNKPVIGFVGRLVREKGIIELIDAFIKVHQNQPCQLLMIGSASLNERDTKTAEVFKQKLKEHNLEHDVILTGHRDDIPQVLSVMDLFVLPSYREGMPVSLLEAMSMQLPVIATNIRGCREEVIPQTGILVPVEDHVSLSLAIEKLLNDKTTAATMGIEGRKRVIQYFSTEQAVEKQMQIFNEIDG
jgi:glycosyltransferase involved in cell wall biosynthesis